jgi:hypothetical protein
MEKLTSIKLQPMINLKNPEMDLFCPTLNFGRKKTGRFKFPIVFNDEKTASQLYDELKLLIGKSIDEVKAASEPLYEKYKKFHYLVDIVN